jgi:hypothetical protein
MSADCVVRAFDGPAQSAEEFWKEFDAQQAGKK